MPIINISKVQKIQTGGVKKLMEIPNIPTINTPSAQPAAPQIPADELTELEQLKAGQALLDDALENVKNSHEIQKETDRAELESKSETEQPPAKTVDERMWDELARWRPSSGISVERNLSQIQDIFRQLAKEIMSGYQGAQQLALLSQLDAITMDALQQLMDQQLQELLKFLMQYGRPDSLQKLADTLFENIAGRKSLTAFGTGSAGSAFPSAGADGKTASGQSSQGIIYQKDSRSVRIDEDYQTSVGKAEKSGTQVLSMFQRGGFYSGIKAFTPNDVEKFQNFVRYLKQNFLGIPPEKAVRTSEEYLGVSAGILSLKSQAFASGNGLSAETASALKYAVNTYIQEYFFNASQSLKHASLSGRHGSAPPFQAGEFQNIYRFITNAYNEKRDAQSAILNGLQKAFERFSQKQADPAYQLMERYAPGLGFFSRTAISSLEKEMWNGWQAICKDWNAFLRYAEISKDKSQSFDYIQNRDYYLAGLLAAERNLSGQKEKKKNFFHNLTRWGIAIFIIGIIIFLLILTNL